MQNPCKTRQNDGCGKYSAQVFLKALVKGC